MNNLSIRHLILAMAADDSRAFKQFFDELYPRFYRLAFYYVKSDILSEELVSDVFLKLWNNRKKLPDIERLDYYFLQSVKNQALTYLKKKSNTLYVEKDKSNRIEYTQPENLLIASELADKIEEAISNLPDRCEMIFRLVREENMSYKEVAELLAISNKTVENQMNNALKKLKFTLDQYQNAHADYSKVSLGLVLILLNIGVS